MPDRVSGTKNKFPKSNIESSVPYPLFHEYHKASSSGNCSNMRQPSTPCHGNPYIPFSLHLDFGFLLMLWPPLLPSWEPLLGALPRTQPVSPGHFQSTRPNSLSRGGIGSFNVLFLTLARVSTGKACRTVFPKAIAVQSRPRPLTQNDRDGNENKSCLI